MGKKSKLRQQRKLDNTPLLSTEIVSGSPLLEFIKKPVDKQRAGNTPLLGKIQGWLNPLSKLNKYQPCFEANDFFEENNTVLGAMSWSGYQETQCPGIVMIQDTNNSSLEMDYIPRQSIRKKLRQFDIDVENIKAIEGMVDVYDHSIDIVMVYVSRNVEMYVTMQKPEMTPQVCYETLHSQM
jgi:hypothetical protein